MKAHPDRDDSNEIARPGDWWYKLPFRVHRNVGVKNEKVICPQSFGKPCPICDYRMQLKKDDGDIDEIKSLNSSDRNLYAILPKGDKKVKSKIHVLDTSDFKFQEVMRAQLKTDERWQTFAHPVEGCSLKVIFDEASFAGNKYAEATRFDFVDRKEELDDALLDEVPNLEKCLNILSYDELKAKFFEANVEDDEDEEEAPKKGKKEEPKARTRKVVEEEEEEEEDEPEEEEEEESLEDEINACKTVGALLTIATNNKEFKSELKTLNKQTKASALKAMMLEILEPAEGEDDEEEEDTGLNDSIEEAETVSDLLAVAKESPDLFKAHIKELRGMTKVRLMKKRMLEIIAENDDLPFEEEEEEQKPLKKQVGKDQCPHGHKFGKDNDSFDECDECEMWKACYKKQKEG
jgi:hypothetical protein